MNRTRPILALFASALLALGACNKSGGTHSAKPDNSDARKQRLLGNLQHEYPQLGQLSPSLGDIKAGPEGMQQVEMELHGPRGPQKQLLLLTPDDKIYMVLGEGPIDASKSNEQLAADAAKKQTEVADELAKATEGQPVRGNPQAKVTIVEFSDFQCPFCKRGFDTMEQVFQKYPKDVKFIFMHYPLPFHEWAKPAAIAAVCATEQDPKVFWTLHDDFFRNQGDINKDNVLDKTAEFLAGSKVDMTKWNTCAKSTDSAEYKAAAAKVEASIEAGQKLGVNGTPAFFINGELVSGAVPLSELDQHIQKALKDKA